MGLAIHIETFRFWEVVTLWARERLQHEDAIARFMASAVINHGLKLSSANPKWMKPPSSTAVLQGHPLVGYRSSSDGEISLLRKVALDHLIAVVESAEVPSRRLLQEEYINRDDLSYWLRCNCRGCRLPDFWYGEST